jgi:signal transduction histidine kinase
MAFSHPKSFTSQIFEALILTALVPFIACIVFAVWQVLENREQTRQQEQEAASNFAAALDNYLAERRDTLEEIAQMLSEAPAGVPAKSAFREQLLYIGNDRFSETLYLNPEGEVLANSSTMSEAAAERAAGYFKKLWEYRETVRSGKSVISRVMIYEGRPGLFIAAPSYSSREGAHLTGILLAKFDLRPLIQNLSFPILAPLSKIQIFNKRNDLVYSDAPEGAEEGHRVKAGLDRLGWTIYVVSPREAFFSSNNQLMMFFFALLAFVAGLTLYLGKTKLKELTNFFGRLTSYIEILHSGRALPKEEAAPQVPLEGQKILGRFTEMAQSLEDSHRELRELNAALEDKVTERTRELQTQYSLLEAVFLGMTNAFAFFDSGRRLLLCNQKFEELFPEASQGPHPVSWDTFLGTVRNPEPWEKVDVHAASDFIWSLKYPVKRIFKAEVFPVYPKVHSGLMELREDEFLGTAVILKDITQDEEVVQLKNDVVALTAHELNNPLSTLSIGLETLLLHRARLSDEKKSTILSDLLDEIHRLQDLIRDWLDISMLNNGVLAFDKKRIDAAEILAESVNGMTLKPGARIFFDKPGCPVYLYADPKRLKQVFINIIQNAFKYNVSKAPELSISVEEKEDRVVFRFKDNGIGIKEEQKKKIFDRFYRSPEAKKVSPNGSGLGLSICFSIVEAHGGKISTEDNVTGGSVFVIELPKEE